MICENCKDKKCLETKKPCKEVEKLLKKDGIFSQDYIRPSLPTNLRDSSVLSNKWREIPFSSLPYEVQKRLGIDQEFNELD